MKIFNIFIVALIYLIIIITPSCAIQVQASDAIKYGSNSTTLYYNSNNNVYPISITADTYGTKRLNFNYRMVNPVSGTPNRVHFINQGGIWLTEWVEGLSSTTNTTVSQDISDILYNGDTVYIVVQAYSTNGMYINNVTISYDIITYSLYGTIYSHENGVDTPIQDAEVRVWLANGTGNTSSYFTGAGGAYSFSSLPSGTYYLQAVKPGEFDPSATEIVVYPTNSNVAKNIYMSGCTVAYNCYYDTVFPIYKVRDVINNTWLEDVTVYFQEYGSSSVIKSTSTGTDGEVSYGIHKNKKYNVTFSKSGYTSVVWSGYPTQPSYIIEMGTINQSYNYTAPTQSYNNTTTGGGLASILNFTSLNTTYGIKQTGQGVLMSISIWFISGVGSGFAIPLLTMVVMLAYYWLGLIGMWLIVIGILTSISLMVIRGEI